MWLSKCDYLLGENTLLIFFSRRMQEQVRRAVSGMINSLDVRNMVVVRGRLIFRAFERIAITATRKSTNG